MTIKDVAKLAGVSPSTVSRVVNNGDTKAASPETQRKIWDVVHSVGYTPNPFARNLKTQQGDLPAPAGEIVCVYGRMVNSFLDPFFGILMHAVEQTAFSRGYILRCYHTTDFSLPLAAANAAIILGRTDSQTFQRLQSHYRHLLYTGLQRLPFDVDQVISSGYKAACLAIRHLLELGHRKICYIGETSNEQRLHGFQDTMAEAGLSVASQYIIDADFSPGKGYEAACQLLERGTEFTAIFCSNDIIAIGAMKALKEHGRKVPEDVSLIGINDIETVRYLSPMLTTVHIPIEEMGTMAAKLLIDRIEGGHQLPLRVELPNAVVSRESCGKPRS